MTEFRVTFGQQYRRDPHPTFDNATPDGWLTVHAPDELTARTAVIIFLDRAWSGIYGAPFDAAEWSGWYPLGEVGCLTTDGTSHDLVMPVLTDVELQRPADWPGRTASAEPEPGDECTVVDVDGTPVRVNGDVANWTPEDHAAFVGVVRAARQKLADDQEQTDGGDRS